MAGAAVGERTPEGNLGYRDARSREVAERLVQNGGCNGFSSAEVATELNITKAALHYHFAGKAELGEALIARYAVRFFQALASVDERMCLCGSG